MKASHPAVTWLDVRVPVFVVLIETDPDFGVESRLGLCAEEVCLGQVVTPTLGG